MLCLKKIVRIFGMTEHISQHKAMISLAPKSQAGLQKSLQLRSAVQLPSMNKSSSRDIVELS